MKQMQTMNTYTLYVEGRSDVIEILADECVYWCPGPGIGRVEFKVNKMVIATFNWEHVCGWEIKTRPTT